MTVGTDGGGQVWRGVQVDMRSVWGGVADTSLCVCVCVCVCARARARVRVCMCL